MGARLQKGQGEVGCVEEGKVSVAKKSETYTGPRTQEECAEFIRVRMKAAKDEKGKPAFPEPWEPNMEQVINIYAEHMSQQTAQILGAIDNLEIVKGAIAPLHSDP